MNYEFAALDFIVNNKDQIVFLEANSSPGALKEYIKFYKHCKPIKELCNLLNKQSYKKLAVISKKKWEKSIVSNDFIFLLSKTATKKNVIRLTIQQK